MMTYYKKNLNKKMLSLLLVAFTISSCTKLDEKLNSTLTAEQAEASVTPESLLLSTYYSMQPAFIDIGLGFWSLQEHPSDECAGPTRATDWDDNGKWRALHQHKWDATHPIITTAFENLLVMQYNATNVLRFKPSKEVAAEARFLRAYSMFCVLDGWGQVPFRDYNEDLKTMPKVLKDTAALNYIVTELNAIIPDLLPRSSTTSYQANQDAARALLMKCYLNKGAFVNRQSPTFDNADMQKVVDIAGQITGYTLTANYFDNFSPNDEINSTENIWGYKSSAGANATPTNGGDVIQRWMPTLHYNQNPGGWNGFCTLEAFYNKFTTTDIRRSSTFAGLTDISGLTAGFLIGQQYNQNGVALKDRKGDPLSFIAKINPSLQENDPATLEITGIRVLKFLPQYINGVAVASNPTNVQPFLRYGDVVLMKAEAQLRMGNTADALATVNALRMVRKAGALASLSLNDMIDERGREMYWEGWRREDLIRFGTFLLPNEAKANTSDPKYLLFPIPVNDLASNTNLKQNDGYQ